MSIPDRYAVLSNLPTAHLVVGRDERIRYANIAAQGLFGDQTVGRALVAIIRDPAVLGLPEQVFATGQSQTTEFSLRHLGAEGRWCVDAGLGAKDEVILSFSDQTPLQNAINARRDFIANVSHELKTPLTSMLGMIETLQGPAQNDPRSRERFLNIMHAEAQRMDRLVRDILALSSVENAERQAPKGNLTLGPLVDQITTLLRPLALQHSVEMMMDCPTDAQVIGDADQIQQLISNLVENAIRYSGAGSKVTISVSQPIQDIQLRRPVVRISIKDTGAGINPLHIPRLTERFYRVDSHRSRNLGGTGLGLSIVKHIITRHRGRLEIHSEIGQGSEFSAYIPTAMTASQ